jgi:2-hydroxychromene-2-carboxylate isomerase
VNDLLGEVPEWVPVHGYALEAGRPEVEAAAARAGLGDVRWPEPFPFDSRTAMLAATFAKQSGRAVAFSLAAMRQAFAGGRDLGDRDSVLVAAAACEMHPAAVVKGAELRATKERLAAATATAAAAGVKTVPALLIGDEIVHQA